VLCHCSGKTFRSERPYPRDQLPLYGLLSTSPVATTVKSYSIFSIFSISANGAENGILWGVVEQGKNGAVLIALNATNLSPLYQSSPALVEAEHFITPMVANGKVYVTTEQNLTVLGLYNDTLVTGGNNQTGEAGATLAKPLSVNVTNAYGGSVMQA
jgi:hypothetical protein